VAGTFKCDNEPSGTMKCGGFIDRWEPLASQEGLCCMERGSVRSVAVNRNTEQ
jgi:hypothetical protein